jgi:hypothetical protein
VGSSIEAGGVIALTAKQLEIYGTIITDIGQVDTTTGTSGGSIMINTSSWDGDGTISAVGMAGSLYGGGGGRIAAYFTTSNFKGQIQCYSYPPVDASNYVYGGPGTIFTKNLSTGYTKLSIDNGGNGQTNIENNSTGAVAWLTEDGVSQFTFDEVQLNGRGALAINATNTGTENVSMRDIHSITTPRDLQVYLILHIYNSALETSREIIPEHSTCGEDKSCT